MALFLFAALTAHAAPVGNAAGTTAAYNYNYMYPYLNNQMRTDLNPGVTPSQSSNPIDAVTRTEKLAPTRRVVPRTARAATSTATTTAQMRSAARSATNATTTARAASAGTTTARAATTSTKRRVVARTGSRDNGTTNVNRASSPTFTTVNNTTAVSSARCMADYKECMDGYCARENTEYNRCYCSAKLAQIDSEYQPEIDRLVRQILTMQSSNAMSDAELSQYWASTIGKYTNDDSWSNIDDALLSINWADLSSRVRGANAFTTGHEYCMKNLGPCSYMASNLRDAYRSDVARDCSTYENGLIKIKTAAESLLENYND